MLVLLPTLILLAAVVAVLLRIFVIDKLQIKNVEDKVVLVTGSAGGFGRKFVAKCLESGMTVLAGCRTKESAEKLLEECKGMKGHLCAFQMDISSEESVMTAKDYVVRQLNKINKDLYAIVNNAGIQAQCMFDDFLTLNAYEEAVEVNAYGPIRVTKLFKDLVKKSKGRIIFCTSAVCRFPAPGMGPYALSKWALTGYVEVIRMKTIFRGAEGYITEMAATVGEELFLRVVDMLDEIMHELREYSVDVITVEPGIFCTPLNSVQKMMNSMNDIWARANDSLREEYGEYWLSRGYITEMAATVGEELFLRVVDMLDEIMHELREYSVDVITVEPGIFCTPLNSVQKMMNSMNDIWARANDSLREEYGEYWLSRGKRVYVDLHDASPSDVTPVSDAYFHAITATCPYKNYVVGLDAMLMFRPFSLLPTRLQELAMKLIEWHYGAPKPAIVD
ncbi:Short-chain dehydrogenase/reductase family 9C member 7 [Toxocara canis]|uniref:Short-chain dehydrogenase/reductase family 9C member 7 n=1 Tax=Toxocara canis TaxID=6265 RepID=A0A0B2VR24_TOXCA|nr:Short-chain dehydrogenase/reductase family 9C member 7 [Toxocara canis]